MGASQRKVRKAWLVLVSCASVWVLFACAGASAGRGTTPAPTEASESIPLYCPSDAVQVAVSDLSYDQCVVSGTLELRAVSGGRRLFPEPIVRLESIRDATTGERAQGITQDFVIDPTAATSRPAGSVEKKDFSLQLYMPYQNTLGPTSIRGELGVTWQPGNLCTVEVTVPAAAGPPCQTFRFPNNTREPRPGAGTVKIDRALRSGRRCSAKVLLAADGCHVRERLEPGLEEGTELPSLNSRDHPCGAEMTVCEVKTHCACESDG